MRLAAASDRIHAAGAEVIAISVDPEERQVGMFDRWPAPHVRFVSDPEGATYLRALDLYDPEERGGIALPGLVIITPEGSEVYRHVGRDFADRTDDEGMMAALESLDLDPVEPPEGGPVGDVSEELRGAFGPEHIGAYFSGTKFGAIAIRRRLGDSEASEVPRQHEEMAEATLEAWKAVRRRS